MSKHVVLLLAAALLAGCAPAAVTGYDGSFVTIQWEADSFRYEDAEIQALAAGVCKSPATLVSRQAVSAWSMKYDTFRCDR